MEKQPVQNWPNADTVHSLPRVPLSRTKRRPPNNAAVSFAPSQGQTVYYQGSMETNDHSYAAGDDEPHSPVSVVVGDTIKSDSITQNGEASVVRTMFISEPLTNSEWRPQCNSSVINPPSTSAIFTGTTPFYSEAQSRPLDLSRQRAYPRDEREPVNCSNLMLLAEVTSKTSPLKSQFYNSSAIKHAPPQSSSKAKRNKHSPVIPTNTSQHFASNGHTYISLLHPSANSCRATVVCSTEPLYAVENKVSSQPIKKRILGNRVSPTSRSSNSRASFDSQISHDGSTSSGSSGSPTPSGSSSSPQSSAGGIQLHEFISPSDENMDQEEKATFIIKCENVALEEVIEGEVCHTYEEVEDYVESPEDYTSQMLYSGASLVIDTAEACNSRSVISPVSTDGSTDSLGTTSDRILPGRKIKRLRLQKHLYSNMSPEERQLRHRMLDNQRSKTYRERKKDHELRLAREHSEQSQLNEELLNKRNLLAFQLEIVQKVLLDITDSSENMFDEC